MDDDAVAHGLARDMVPVDRPVVAVDGAQHRGRRAEIDPEIEARWQRRDRRSETPGVG